MLSPIKIALQGLFPFTPIAAAVQGLIDELIEEARQAANVVGGRGGRHHLPGPPRLDWLQRGDDLTEERVRAHWDLLEARLAKPREDVRAIPETRLLEAEPRGAGLVLLTSADSEAAARAAHARQAIADRRAAQVERANQAAQADDDLAIALLLIAAATA